MDTIDNSQMLDQNLSILAGNVVSNAVQATRHLFCPFCADFFLFEFTLKDHLKQTHSDELQKQLENTAMGGEDDTVNNEYYKEKCCCKFCGAVFKYAGLLPKHIVDYHDAMCFNLWQQNEPQKIDRPSLNGQSMDPTILYARCSPGLSALFDKFSTKETIEDSPAMQRTSTPLKSILKKSAQKSATRIICSPSSAGIRRTKNTTLVRRSSSARRELRFDINDNENEMPISKLPGGAGELKTLSSSLNEPNSPNKNRKHAFKQRNLIRRLFLGQCASQKKKNKSKNKMVTSTPLSFLDDSSDSISLMSDIQDDKNNAKDWKIIRQKTKPLFSYLERYQCAHCKRTWESNAELLAHLNDKHKNIRKWFLADYRCGACSAKFFSNRFLVRHCHTHHTPLKRHR